MVGTHPLRTLTPIVVVAALATAAMFAALLLPLASAARVPGRSSEDELSSGLRFEAAKSSGNESDESQEFDDKEFHHEESEDADPRAPPPVVSGESISAVSSSAVVEAWPSPASVASSGSSSWSSGRSGEAVPEVPSLGELWVSSSEPLSGSVDAEPVLSDEAAEGVSALAEVSGSSESFASLDENSSEPPPEDMAPAEVPVPSSVEVDDSSSSSVEAGAPVSESSEIEAEAAPDSFLGDFDVEIASSAPLVVFPPDAGVKSGPYYDGFTVPSASNLIDENGEPSPAVDGSPPPPPAISMAPDASAHGQPPSASWAGALLFFLPEMPDGLAPPPLQGAPARIWNVSSPDGVGPLRFRFELSDAWHQENCPPADCEVVVYLRQDDGWESIALSSSEGQSGLVYQGELPGGGVLVAGAANRSAESGVGEGRVARDVEQGEPAPDKAGSLIPSFLQVAVSAVGFLAATGLVGAPRKSARSLRARLASRMSRGPRRSSQSTSLADRLGKRNRDAGRSAHGLYPILAARRLAKAASEWRGHPFRNHLAALVPRDSCFAHGMRFNLLVARWKLRAA